MKDPEIVTNRSGTFTKLPRVTEVKPLEGFVVHLVFSDGTEKDVDLEPYLHGPIFEPIRSDPDYFRTVHVEIDTIAWSNQADIAPETLYYGDTVPPWFADEEEKATTTGKGKRRSKAGAGTKRQRSPTATRRALGRKKHTGARAATTRH